MKNNNESKEILISEEFAGLRLDLFLAKIKIVSTRSQALKLISGKHVFLNESPLKASYRLNSGDVLKVFLPPKKSESLHPYDFPLEIVYEDKEVLVINKPAGLVVHPSPGHEQDTLVNVLYHQKKLSPGVHPLRPGIVHRLDKDASGLLVLAKTKHSQDHLIQQFKEHSVKREYWAISLHPPSPLKGVIETWITRHPIHRKKFISLEKFKNGSKKACTFYELFCQHPSGLSWVKCRLKTGRTHQIRVHLSSLSCPLIGDKLYGGQKKLSFIKDVDLKEEVKKLNRIALHSHSLSFSHPLTGEKKSFKSSWPSDLKAILKKLDFLK